MQDKNKKCPYKINYEKDFDYDYHPVVKKETIKANFGLCELTSCPFYDSVSLSHWCKRGTLL